VKLLSMYLTHTFYLGEGSAFVNIAVRRDIRKRNSKSRIQLPSQEDRPDPPDLFTVSSATSGTLTKLKPS
jgi:hypothetical protein